MKRFAELYRQLDSTNSTLRKVEAMAEYFKSVSPSDAAWALYFLTGRKILRLLPTQVLRETIQEFSRVPEWLFEECYSAVGDLAETIALLIPTTAAETEDVSLETWVTERLLPLKGRAPEEQKAELMRWWKTLSTWEVFVLNKLMTGSFRTGVSQSLVIKALSRISGTTEAAMAHRLMGKWDPTSKFFKNLLEKKDGEKDPGVPYPFFLASPIEEEPQSLGDVDEWLFEWKWDGIRAQAIKREGGVFLWSRGEELITDRFPEIVEAVSRLPNGTVLDGEILAFTGNKVAPFSLLQTRIGRKTVSQQMLKDVPAILMTYDLLEKKGKDLREEPLSERREELETLLRKANDSVLKLSEAVTVKSWDELSERRTQSRERNVEGLMMKRQSSPYRVGRKRGDWWKWKVDPFTMDAVFLYAQPGHGRRSTLYTDYTFGIWKDKELVPIAKAYSGLTDAEILEMDRWIRRNTVEKFGPVRKVNPELVFELAFEAIAPSPRHKAGLAVRFPRILRKRDDKKPVDADTVEKVQRLMYAA